MAEKFELLLLRAQRALGNNRVDAAVAKVRAIVGPAEIPNSEEKAQTAFNKLREGEEPDADELAALEIVIRLLRPVVYTRQGGKIDDLPSDAGHNLYPEELKDLWSSFRTSAEKAMASVGRVERNGQHVGTGFVVGEGLLATNRHVLAQLTYGAEVIAPEQTRVVFKQEKGETNPANTIVAIESVHAIHPHLDMVLLKLGKHERAPLAFEKTRLEEGARIVVVGYPGEDKENNPLFLTSVFGGGFGVRRAALGEILDGSLSPAIFHDCSTTRGNSGSPVFSLESGKVAGIHRAGFFMYRNEAIDVTALAKFVK